MGDSLRVGVTDLVLDLDLVVVLEETEDPQLAEGVDEADRDCRGCFETLRSDFRARARARRQARLGGCHRPEVTPIQSECRL
jgi:hypothetical protein